MQIIPSYDIIHSTKFSSDMMKKDICIRNVWFFAERFYWMCSTIWACQFGYHGNILGSSYAWSSKHRNMLTQVCGLVQCFATWKSLTYWMKRVGTGKEQVAMGTEFFYSCTCVSCRAISLPSFNGQHCKLTKIARSI